MIIEMKCFDGGRAILFVGDEAAALREWEDGCEPDEIDEADGNTN
jgi:hypothetical protein